MSEQEIEFNKKGITLSYTKVFTVIICTISLMCSIVWSTYYIANCINVRDSKLQNHDMLLGEHTGQIKELKENQVRFWDKLNTLNDKIDKKQDQ